MEIPFEDCFNDLQGISNNQAIFTLIEILRNYLLRIEKLEQMFGSTKFGVDPAMILAGRCQTIENRLKELEEKYKEPEVRSVSDFHLYGNCVPSDNPPKEGEKK